MTANTPTVLRRHWRDRFQKGMPLVFLKPVRLDAKRSVSAGDPVTPELRAELGEHRMKLWHMARVVGHPEKVLKAPEPEPEPVKPEPTPVKGSPKKR